MGRAVLDPAELRSLIESEFPGAELELEDLTGTRDHYRLRIVSERFEGLSPVAQHRLVYAALSTHMRGDIHALALDTYTPERWARRPR